MGYDVLIKSIKHSCVNLTVRLHMCYDVLIKSIKHACVNLTVRCTWAMMC